MKQFTLDGGENKVFLKTSEITAYHSQTSGKCVIYCGGNYFIVDQSFEEVFEILK